MQLLSETGGLSALTKLELTFQTITNVPDEIERLKNLKTLNVSNNPRLVTISGNVGNLQLDSE